jgi:hypothetical protein
MFLASLAIQAQSVFGTITGTVTDASGSVIPNANVTAKNEASGDVRRSVTNGDGYYTFPSVPAGSYSILVEAAGFQRTQENGLSLLGAETRKADIAMQVGTSKSEVTITDTTDIVGTVDSGEKASVLTTKQLQDFSVVGRSAAEFIKILPGFTSINSGVQNKPGYNGEVIGINGNGEGGKQSAVGNYSANGLGAASIDITADGSHVSDPGCNCASPVNPEYRHDPGVQGYDLQLQR